MLAYRAVASRQSVTVPLTGLARVKRFYIVQMGAKYQNKLVFA